MRNLFGSRRSASPIWLGTLFVLAAITLAGCRPPASATPLPEDGGQSKKPDSEVLVQRNLLNALTAMKPENLGISSDPEKTVATLNEWAKSEQAEATKRGEPWTPPRDEQWLKSVPSEWGAAVKSTRFIERDATHVRNAMWAHLAANFAVGTAEADLDRVVNLFEFVVRNVELLASDKAAVPLTAFDTLVIGRGTAEDRAWLFADLLRQLQIDSVILAPRRAANDSRGSAQFLIGVLLERDVLLFDPAVGLPMPADWAAPQSAVPRRPATLRQLLENPPRFAPATADSENPWEWTAGLAKALRIQLICDTAVLSWRMRYLQDALTGENSAIVSDPLADAPDAPGLWSRVVRHPAAAWDADDVSIWTYPELTLEAATHLEPDQVKELARMTDMMAAPRRLRSVAKDTGEFQFGQPERILMKLRLKHVMGQWADAVQGYLAVQLYEGDPPTVKDWPTITPDDKRIVRAEIEGKYPAIQRMHAAAGDNACFWQAQCQFEQNRATATISQCVAYLNRYPRGVWTASARLLLSESLAREAKLPEAIRIASDIDPDAPNAPRVRALISRWKLLQAAAKSQ